jgi:ABC-type transporter lipoprotein component MlaA
MTLNTHLVQAIGEDRQVVLPRRLEWHNNLVDLLSQALFLIFVELILLSIEKANKLSHDNYILQTGDMYAQRRHQRAKGVDYYAILQ